MHQGVDVIIVNGEVDLYSASALKETVYEILDSGASSIILDMTGLEFMDSSGLGVLVGTLKRVRSAGGSLWLICDRDNLLKVFKPDRPGQGVRHLPDPGGVPGRQLSHELS